MAKPIVNPDVPYVGDIPGLQVGRMVRIQGAVSRSADRFTINLQTGPNDKPRDDTGLHISVRLSQGYIARNSYVDGNWGDEQGSGDLPIGNGQQFEILILCDARDFKIAINGQHFCEFPYRIPKEKLTHLLIDGDVDLTLISWEGQLSGAGGDLSATQASQVHSAGSPNAPPSAPQGFGAPPAPQQGGYGQGPPPQQGGYGGPPPQGGYGGVPPQGGYGGPPQGYGPPQGGFGAPPHQGYGPPPPPGSQPQTGLDSFFDSAQSVLAEAIASGAAQKLLGDILHPNQQKQGYAPQNAQYGVYPSLPTHNQQQPPQRSQGGDFNLGSLGGDGSAGGLGGFLTSLATSVLRPRNNDQQPLVPPSSTGIGIMPVPMPTPQNIGHYQPPPSVLGPNMPQPVITPSSYPNNYPSTTFRPYPVQPPTIPGSYPYSHPHYPPSTPLGHHLQPVPGYPHIKGQKMDKKEKKKLKKALKYGLPIAGAGLGAYALASTMSHHHHHHHRSSSSSSSSSSD